MSAAATTSASEWGSGGTPAISRSSLVTPAWKRRKLWPATMAARNRCPRRRRHELPLGERETGEVARDDLDRGHFGEAPFELGLQYRVGLFAALLPAIDRVRQHLRRVEPLLVEGRQLSHSSQVVVPDEKDDVVRRVRIGLASPGRAAYDLAPWRSPAWWA